MATPEWKLYDRDGTYQACAKEPEALACALGLYGEGATIRFGHSKDAIVWTEGTDFGANGEIGCNSWDSVAETCFRRAREYKVRCIAKQYRISIEEAEARLVGRCCGGGS